MSKFNIGDRVVAKDYPCIVKRSWRYSRDRYKRRS